MIENNFLIYKLVLILFTCYPIQANNQINDETETEMLKLRQN
jgi:hypothetical protein